MFLGWIPGGVFFIFWKISFLGPTGPVGPKRARKLWGSLETSKGIGFSCMLVSWVKTWRIFFIFIIWKLYFGGPRNLFGPKGPFIFTYSMYHKSKARFPGHRVWGSRVKTSPCGIYYFRTWNLVHLINTSRKIDWTWSRDVKMTSWRKMTSHREKWPLSRQNELFL